MTKDIVDNVYVNPSKTTVGEWLDAFLNDYNGDVRSGTAATYETTIRVHLKPTLGGYKLTSLTTEMIQKAYRAIENGATSRQGKLSPKTVKNCHGVLHKALKKAQRLGYIRVNPADAVTLPKTEKPIIRPLTNDEVAKLLAEISGHKYEDLFFFTIFTGMRQSEVLGLTWECVDLERGIITIKRQLLPPKGEIKDYHFAPLKNSTIRTEQIPKALCDILVRRKNMPNSDNEMNLVFVNELGGHLCHKTIWKSYKKISTDLGLGATRFHDLRHTYAALSLQNGDSIKTVQDNLGHSTAAFTQQVYGHTTDLMKQRSADRMDAYISEIGKNSNS